MRRWAVGTLVATFLLTGCAKSVAGDASPVAGVATASQRAAEGTNSTDTASTTPAMSEPPTASPTSPTPSATTPSPSATPSPTPSTTSSSPTPSATTPSPTASDSKAATPPAIRWLLPAQSKVKAKVNSFGNLVAGLGRPYEVTWNTRKTTALRFIVDSAVVDGRCETPTKPQNGHFLILGVRVQLGDATAEDLGDSRIGFTGENWTAFDARNVADVNTTSSAAGDCITYKTGFPYTSELAPGKVYSGKVALDVSSARGTVVLMDSVGGGWIYNYG